MVYVIDSQNATSSYNSVTRRNTLFTAITRSRAWVCVTGWGEGMAAISTEVEKVRNNNFKLDFTIPTAERLTQLRRIDRDASGASKESRRRAQAGVEAFLDAYEKQEIDLQDLPPALRNRLLASLREETPGDYS